MALSRHLRVLGVGCKTTGVVQPVCFAVGENEALGGKEELALTGPSLMGTEAVSAVARLFPAVLSPKWVTRATTGVTRRQEFYGN